MIVQLNGDPSLFYGWVTGQLWEVLPGMMLACPICASAVPAHRRDDHIEWHRENFVATGRA